VSLTIHIASVQVGITIKRGKKLNWLFFKQSIWSSLGYIKKHYSVRNAEYSKWVTLSSVSHAPWAFNCLVYKVQNVFVYVSQVTIFSEGFLVTTQNSEISGQVIQRCFKSEVSRTVHWRCKIQENIRQHGHSTLSRTCYFYLF